MRHLRLGFLALRLGDLAGGAGHYDDAASEFQWAIDLQPDLAVCVVRHGPGRIRHRGFAGNGGGGTQDHVRQGRARPVGRGLREDCGSRSLVCPRTGRAREHRAPAAGQHQARRRPRCPPARLGHLGRLQSAGPARARAGGTGGGQSRLRGGGVHALSGDGWHRRGSANWSWRGRSCGRAIALPQPATTSPRRATTRPWSRSSGMTFSRSRPTPCWPTTTASTGFTGLPGCSSSGARATTSKWAPRATAWSSTTAAGSTRDAISPWLPYRVTTRSTSASSRAARTSTTAASSTCGTAIRRRARRSAARVSGSTTGWSRTSRGSTCAPTATCTSILLPVRTCRISASWRASSMCWATSGRCSSRPAVTTSRNDPMAKDLLISRQDFAPIYQRILNTSGTGFQRAVSDERLLGRSNLDARSHDRQPRKALPDRPRRVVPGARRRIRGRRAAAARWLRRARREPHPPAGAAGPAVHGAAAVCRRRPERAHRGECRHDAPVRGVTAGARG